MTKGWTQATPGDIVKLEEGERIEGMYISCDQSAMYPDSFAFVVDTKKGAKTVFVNSIVRDLVQRADIRPGTEVAVLFKGFKKNQAGTRSYKDYEVFYKE